MTNQQFTNFQPNIQKNTDNKLLEREGASHPEQHKAPKNINNWLNLEELAISVMLTVMHMIISMIICYASEEVIHHLRLLKIPSAPTCCVASF